MSPRHRPSAGLLRHHRHRRRRLGASSVLWCLAATLVAALGGVAAPTGPTPAPASPTRPTAPTPAPDWRSAPMTTATVAVVPQPAPEPGALTTTGFELQRSVPGTDPTAPEQVAGATGLAPFVVVGFSWRGPDDPTARFRVHTDAGWSDWRPVGRDGDHAPDDREAGGPPSPQGPDTLVTSDPTWVGTADGWQLGLGEAAHDVRVHLVRPGPGDDAGDGDDTGNANANANGDGGGGDDADDGFRRQVNGVPAGAAPVPEVPLDAGRTAVDTGRFGAERPPILGRGTWGARPARAQTWTATSLRLVVVHHTGSGESSTYAEADVPAMLRATQAYHMDANGWNDLGYNFVVDRFGRIWEGRQGGVDTLTVGAHAYGLNTGSMGVVVLGDFRSAAPSDAALDGVARLVAWKLFRHGADPERSAVALPRDSERFAAGQPVSLPRIVGHQDVNQTACPGTVEQFLPQLRAEVAARYRTMVGRALLVDGTVGGPGSIGPGDGARPLVGDFDKDGRDDIFWYRPGTGADALWSSGGGSGLRARPVTVDDDGTATLLDWDGDGATDVLISVPGRTTVRLLQGVAAADGGGFASMQLNAPGSAIPVPGDYDGDGDEDVLFYEPAAQRATLFGYDTGAAPGPVLTVAGGPYRPAVGDFDGDQRDDIVWYAPGSGGDGVWYGRGLGSFDLRAVAAGGDLTPIVADLDGDQRDDIVWSAAGGGTLPVWLGGATFAPTEIAVGPADHLVLADVDGGGSADVIGSQWGWARVWLRQGDQARLGRDDAIAPGSVPVPADFDGDGRREVWWWVPGSDAQDGAVWRAT